MTTPDDPTILDPSDDDVAPPRRIGRPRSLGLDAIQRYLPILAVAGMVATYLEVANAYLALTIIGAVWLIATRIASSRRFLGLTLTEGLAWDATVLILLFIAALVLGGAQ